MARRLAVQDYIRLEEAAAALSNDPYFGLHVGEYFDPSAWSILGFMMMNCRTLGEAFQKSEKYSAIIGTMLRGRAVFSGGAIRLILEAQAGSPALSRHCAETVFSSSIRMLRSLSDPGICPEKVLLKASAPYSDAEYRRIFRCPVLFDQSEDSISLDARIPSLPVRLPDASMLEHFEAFADEYLAGIEGMNATSRTVTRLILAHLDDESLTIKKIAAEMNVSARTLQSRLESERIGFSDLLRDARVRLAKKYLRERKPVDDITYMLGFSEPSVFRKAFKKWTGLTPGEYRDVKPTLDFSARLES